MSSRSSRPVKNCSQASSTFEIQPTFGRALITALARMDGYVVGIVANNPMFGGIMDYKAARKQGHFVELCDMFNIPLIFFADIPGLIEGAHRNVGLGHAFLLVGSGSLHWTTPARSRWRRSAR